MEEKKKKKNLKSRKGLNSGTIFVNPKVNSDVYEKACMCIDGGGARRRCEPHSQKPYLSGMLDLLRLRIRQSVHRTR